MRIYFAKKGRWKTFAGQYAARVCFKINNKARARAPTQAAFLASACIKRSCGSSAHSRSRTMLLYVWLVWPRQVSGLLHMVDLSIALTYCLEMRNCRATGMSIRISMRMRRVMRVMKVMLMMMVLRKFGIASYGGPFDGRADAAPSPGTVSWDHRSAGAPRSGDTSCECKEIATAMEFMSKSNRPGTSHAHQRTCPR